MLGSDREYSTGRRPAETYSDCPTVTVTPTEKCCLRPSRVDSGGQYFIRSASDLRLGSIVMIRIMILNLPVLITLFKSDSSGHAYTTFHSANSTVNLGAHNPNRECAMPAPWPALMIRRAFCSDDFLHCSFRTVMCPWDIHYPGSFRPYSES